jgi:hypothetical protein
MRRALIAGSIVAASLWPLVSHGQHPKEVPPSPKRVGILTLGIAGHDLAVEDSRLGWHLAKQRCDRGEALGEVVLIAAEQDDARAHLVGLHALAV